jgi:hypothetical protein
MSPKPTHAEKILILFSAVVAMLLDFAVEYRGTTTGSWHYLSETSIFEDLLFKGIPIELPVLFAFYGATLALIALKTRKGVTLDENNRHLSKKTVIAFFASIIGIIWYISRFLLLNGLIFTIPIFFLGVSLTPLTKEISGYGVVVFLLDLLIEVYIVATGFYSYVQVETLIPRIAGFPLLIPLEYGLLTIGGILILSYLAAWYDKWSQLPYWYKYFISKRIEVGMS